MLGLANALVTAKGVTRRLVVTGPTLPAPLEITDQAALANVWGEEFMGAPAAEPDSSWSRYEVAFYVQPPRTEAVRMMYVAIYVRDPTSGAGFVYLPSRGEEHYRLNVRTILREGQDGKWHHASEAWNEAISKRLGSRPSTLRP